MESSILKELRKWKPHPAVQQLYKLVLRNIYEQGDALRKKEVKTIREEMNRLTTRQTKARELLLSDSMEPDDYKLVKRECEQSLVQLEAKLVEFTTMQIDIVPMMDDAVALLGNLDIIYEKGGTLEKRELIGSIFPEKLQFDGIGYRTARLNEAVQLIYSMGKAFGEIKMGQISSFSDLSHQVIPLGCTFGFWTLQLFTKPYNKRLLFNHL